MNDKVSAKITFEICVSTNKVGSEVTKQIHIDKSDLEGIPEDKWEDFVFEELGGNEIANEMIHTCVRRK